MGIVFRSRRRRFHHSLVFCLTEPARPVLLSLLILIACSPVPGVGQEKKAEPTLNVGFSTAQPGDPIDIPITLSGTEQPQTGLIAVELTFPKPALTFVRADAGLAGEMAEADIQGKVRDAPNDSKLSVLTISLSARKPVKPGIVAYLKFHVPTEAKKGRVQFKVLSVKAATLSGAPQPLTKGRDGAVEVYDRDEEVPQIGCFFFTH